MLISPDKKDVVGTTDAFERFVTLVSRVGE